MKTRKLLLLALMLSTTFAFAQSIEKWQERAKQNLSLLTSDPELLERVKIDNKGIFFMTEKLNQFRKTEFSIYWKELSKVVLLLENEDYNKLVKTFEIKKDQVFQDFAHAQEGHFHRHVNFPKDVKGMYIALDPGHFGGDKTEAQLEARFVQMSAEALGMEQDGFFFEADLTYATCLIIKQELEKLGAVVEITRPYGASAMGLGFDEWLEKQFLTDLKKALDDKDIDQKKQDELILSYSSRTNATEKKKLFEFYKFLDFRTRADKINNFGPDLVLVVHYNASDNSKRDGQRYSVPVNDSYNMVFVPGGFNHTELTKTEYKLDFLRLLLSPHMEQSVAASNFIMEEFTNILKVPRHKMTNDSKLYSVTTSTGYDGIYGRNLAMTRMIKAPLVYGETLIQDNPLEAKELIKKTITLIDVDGTTIKTSPRVKNVALGYVNGIIKWCDFNQANADRF